MSLLAIPDAELDAASSLLLVVVTLLLLFLLLLLDSNSALLLFPDLVLLFVHLLVHESLEPLGLGVKSFASVARLLRATDVHDLILVLLFRLLVVVLLSEHLNARHTAAALDDLCFLVLIIRVEIVVVSRLLRLGSEGLLLLALRELRMKGWRLLQVLFQACGGLAFRLTPARTFGGLTTIIISEGYILKVEGLVVGAHTDRWQDCALLLLFLLFPGSL